MRHVHQVIEEHIDDPGLNVSVLSAELGVSRTQLYKKFKAVTDLSIAQFVRKVRLHKARYALERTDLTVSQVALEYGFSSPSTFSRSFREEFDMTPSDVVRSVG